MPALYLTHIDTCLPCYLTDHHNRDGEMLLQAYVDGSTTIGEVREELKSALQMYELPSGWSYDDARAAIADYFGSGNDARVFDRTLDVFDEDSDDVCEQVYAYFLLSEC